MSIDDEIEDISAHGLKAALDAEIARMMDKYGVQSVFLNVTFTAEDKKTRSITSHCGNYYASYGALRSWMISADEGDRIDERKDKGLDP